MKPKNVCWSPSSRKNIRPSIRIRVLFKNDNCLILSVPACLRSLAPRRGVGICVSFVSFRVLCVESSFLSFFPYGSFRGLRALTCPRTVGVKGQILFSFGLPSTDYSSLDSSLRYEYHPLVLRRPQAADAGGSQPKKSSNNEDFDERGETRTLNQWLKRPLLCH
jgi:hypothetical protein